MKPNPHMFCLEREVLVELDRIVLHGTLRRPTTVQGVVLFAHGSGSSRHSPRNRAVADVLNTAGFATLLMDLLTETETGDREKVFDVQLLAMRVAAADRWLTATPEWKSVPIGYFGASTGSAAALIATARP